MVRSTTTAKCAHLFCNQETEFWCVICLQEEALGSYDRFGRRMCTSWCHEKAQIVRCTKFRRPESKCFVHLNHLSSESVKPKSPQRRTRNPAPVRNDPVDDTCNLSDDDELLPVLHSLPTRVGLTNNGCRETED